MKLRNMVLGLGILALSLSVGAMASEQPLSGQGMARIQKQVRHELNMLPYVNVFDYMTFTVDENGGGHSERRSHESCSQERRGERREESGRR